MTTLYSTTKPTCVIDENLSHKNFTSTLKQVLHTHMLFHYSFLAVGALELFGCLIFFNLVANPHLLAITLAVFLMTFFSYFTLRVYFQNKKPQKLLFLCEQTIDQIHSEQENSDSMFVATTLIRLINSLKDIEYHLYSPPKSLESLKQSIEKFSCFLFWRDLQFIKERLYTKVIEIYIEKIKEEPDNLQVHMALANTYVLFSSIYAVPTNNESDKDQWIPAEKFSLAFQERFEICAKRAIEEFKILNDYNPEDPWVYLQLAYSYHDLKMPEDEIKAYEKIVSLCPDDDNAFYKLGVLYFQSGQIAKGLKIYEHLKSSSYQKAARLIKHYSSLSESFYTA